jgi:hypothetical protein
VAERDLELWRANFLALALWRVAHGEARWVELVPQDPAPRGAGCPRAYAGGPSHPAFLPIYVPRSPAGDPPHELRLYRDTYQAFLRGLSLGERQALEAHLGLGKPRRLLYWHTPTGPFPPRGWGRGGHPGGLPAPDAALRRYPARQGPSSGLK